MSDESMVGLYVISWALASYFSFWFFESRGGKKEVFNGLSPMRKGLKILIHIGLGYMLYGLVFGLLVP
jgi:hypothetical protein